MALLELFPKNYVWNLSVSIALASGAEMGEVVDMCQPLRDAAAGGVDLGTAAFLAEWVKMGDNLAALANEDTERNRKFSAANKLRRAALYYLTAERMQGHGHPGREETFTKAQTAFRSYITLGNENYERHEVAY